jgi:hypothetical protein
MAGTAATKGCDQLRSTDGWSWSVPHSPSFSLPEAGCSATRILQEHKENSPEHHAVRSWE